MKRSGRAQIRPLILSRAAIQVVRDGARRALANVNLKLSIRDEVFLVLLGLELREHGLEVSWCL